MVIEAHQVRYMCMVATSGPGRDSDGPCRAPCRRCSAADLPADFQGLLSAMHAVWLERLDYTVLLCFSFVLAAEFMFF